MGIKLVAGAATIISTCSTMFATTEISVNADKPVGSVKKYIFGHNVAAADPRGIFSDTFDAETFDTQYIKAAEGFWDPVNQKPNENVVAEALKTGISVMRYPGGCCASNYDWRKAVGPLEKRGYWRFGLDEYIELCRSLGAEPMITCSDYVLAAEEMPQHLADMVEYLNAPATSEYPWAMKRKEWGNPEPYGVKFFELGNESDAGNYYCKPRRKFNHESYSKYANDSAAAMRKIDPSIKIGVQYGIGEDAYKSADFIIVHHYGAQIGGQDVKENFKSTMAHIEYYGQGLQERKKRIRELVGRDIPMALTEYNQYFFANKPHPYRFSSMAGLFCADMIRMLLLPESGMDMANYWQISNGYFGMIFSRNGNILRRRAPLAYFQLWGEHFGEKLLSVNVKNSPKFNSAAIQDTPKAEGNEFMEAKFHSDVTPAKYSTKDLARNGITLVPKNQHTLSFQLNQLQKSVYTQFGYIKNPVKGTDMKLKMSFESRFIPEKKGTPSANLGLSLNDSRGWQKTRSAVAKDGLENNNEWKEFSINFTPLKDCPGIQVLFRAPNVAAPLSGTLEIRNFRIETWTPAVIPAYEGITSSASLSEDGKTLHLIVFNRSLDQELPCNINLKGFIPKSATSWTAGSVPENLEYVPPVSAEVNLPQSGRPVQINFPPHSMTAIDFKR